MNMNITISDVFGYLISNHPWYLTGIEPATLEMITLGSLGDRSGDLGGYNWGKYPFLHIRRVMIEFTIAIGEYLR